MKLMRRLSACLVLMTGLMTTGCGAPPSMTGLKQALADYNAQRYAQAHEKAADVAAEAPAGARAQAAYLAGLSAYQLHELPEAEKHLIIAAASSDAQTAARELVMPAKSASF